MEKTIKIILAVLVAVYVFSPVDLIPGPVDDLLAILLGCAGEKITSLIAGNRDSNPV